MKHKSFLFLFFLSAGFGEGSAQNFWKQIQSPVNQTLHNLFFTDSLNGWAAGDSGVLINTTDGGLSWQIKNSNVENTIWGIHFIDNSFGWMVSWLDDSLYNGTIISKTSNGGEEWEKIEFPQTLTYIEDIFFLDSLTGFAGVNYSPVRGPIYYTNDGGANWNLAAVLPDTLNYPFLPVQKFYSSYGKIFACGGAIDIAGVIWKSTDDGVSWRADSTVAPDPINELFLFDSLNILGIGGDRELFYGVGIVRSTDGGNFWEYDELSIFGVANTMDFRTPEEGWASLGILRSFIYTSDSGYTWQEVSTPNNTEINSIKFIDSTTGFAVGKDGVILNFKYKPNSTINNSSAQPEEFYLHQNYPNPFNPITNIIFIISTPIYQGGNLMVSLKVYDVLGNEIAVLVNEEKSPGEYEVQFNASGLSSGIYYYRLSAGEYTFTKKMMFVK